MKLTTEDAEAARAEVARLSEATDPTSKAMRAALERALAPDVGRRGDALDSVRTEAARAKLATLKEGRIEELQSAMDYLYSRAIRDPSDAEARGLAIKALLANKEPMRSAKINRLLAPGEQAVAHIAHNSDTETAFETLKGHGFKPMSGAPQMSAVRGQHLDRVSAKMKAFEKAAWLPVIDLSREEDHGAADLDTASGFSGGPEQHRFTLFRTPTGHVARLIGLDLIGGEPYVGSLYYLEHAGF